ncbi:MAG: class I SAM-dependent methyltransferase [Actinobacteria bacterium]|nr:class I SAM-dependent methyltransferase [Actinomycetota bacterium]
MTFWDERYGSVEWAFGTEPNDFLRESAAAIPPGSVLCIGDGEGRNGVFLASLGHEVTSVDLSAVGLGKARALAAERGAALHTVQADLAGFDVGVGCWVGIVSIFCHLPGALRDDLFPRLVAGLAPGGVVLVESYTPAQIGRGTGGPQDVDLLETPGELARRFAALACEHVWEGERLVVEGAFHSGTASVVQYIGRRVAEASA